MNITYFLYEEVSLNVVLSVLFIGFATVIAFLTQDNSPSKATITYKIGEDTVQTYKVATGKKLGIDYTYESDDLQSYATSWRDENNIEYTAETVINSSATLFGIVKNTLVCDIHY